ncbi:hypothetical protein GF420_14660 [candidate division GN15 bacterium]|nr:hypothetical protein [candidate division GN15 bacterium]
MRLIKRYKNRRLYDTGTSRSITQFELARMIEEGEEIRVIDSVTGEDITLTVLGRVMAGQSQVWDNVSDATEFLQNAIRTGKDTSMNILKNTVLASIGLFNVTKAKAEKIIDDLIKRGEVDKSQRKDAVMELLERADKSTESFRKKVLDEADKAGKGVSKFAKDNIWVRQSDLKKLDNKITRLTKKVRDLEEKIGEYHPEPEEEQQ